jgi:hypothetical protein
MHIKAQILKIAAQVLQYWYSLFMTKSSAHALLLSSYLGQNPSGTLAIKVKILRITTHIISRHIKAPFPGIDAQTLLVQCLTRPKP